VTATAGSPAKAALCVQGDVLEPRLELALLVQADLKLPGPLGSREGSAIPRTLGLCWPWLCASTCSNATCTHLTIPSTGASECLQLKKYKQLKTVFLFSAFKVVAETA